MQCELHHIQKNIIIYHLICVCVKACVCVGRGWVVDVTLWFVRKWHTAMNPMHLTKDSPLQLMLLLLCTALVWNCCCFILWNCSTFSPRRWWWSRCSQWSWNVCSPTVATSCWDSCPWDSSWGSLDRWPLCGILCQNFIWLGKFLTLFGRKMKKVPLLNH